MKYSIEFNELLGWYQIHTTFIVTENLVNLIALTRGVSVYDIHNYSRQKYRIDFSIGNLFDIEEVNQNLSKVLDAYIVANPNADNAEDKAIREFAKDNEQFRFLENFNKK